ncbi:MAG TPA: TSUP family transporter [candidate division Zixibacteria bacterium]|nr:TSUP family transporter [candidate division Zixibacteria bacterium]
MTFFADFAPIMLIIVAIAFLSEFMDASLGMGYGTTLTPVLLILGYDAAVIVPSVLLSELITGIVSTIAHGLLKNYKLGQKKRKIKRITRKRTRKVKRGILITDPIENLSGLSNIQTNTTPSSGFQGIDDVSDEEDDEFEYEDVIEEIEVDIESKTLKEKLLNLTDDTKVILILSAFGIIGTIFSAVISVIFSSNEIFNFGVKIYIGLMVFAMGIIILALRKKEFGFSLKRIVSLGAIAGFNKGISGGGYGPITVSGQILSGREGKSAIASTSFSETIICFFGVSAYIITNIIENYRESISITWEYLELAPYLVIGAVISAPLAALVTNKIKNEWLKVGVGWATILLGIFSLIRIILLYLGIWEKIPSFVDMTALGKW